MLCHGGSLPSGRLQMKHRSGAEAVSRRERQAFAAILCPSRGLRQTQSPSQVGHGPRGHQSPMIPLRKGPVGYHVTPVG